MSEIAGDAFLWVYF